MRVVLPNGHEGNLENYSKEDLLQLFLEVNDESKLSDIYFDCFDKEELEDMFHTSNRNAITAEISRYPEMILNDFENELDEDFLELLGGKVLE